MHRWGKYRNTFFTRIFITLSLAVIVLTVSCGLIFDKMMQNYAEERIGESRRSNQIKLEEYMQELTRTLQRDALNLSVILSQTGLTDKTEAVYKLREAQAKLSSATRTNSALVSMYLYLEQSGYIITSYNGCYKMGSFLDQDWYEPYQSLNPIDNAVWLPVRTIHSLQSLEGRDAGVPVLTYIYRLSSYTTPELQGALIYNVNEKELAQKMNAGSNRQSESMQVLDARGMVLCDLSRENLGKDFSQVDYVEKILNSPEESGYFTMKSEQGKTLVSWYKSGFNGWIFVDSSSVEAMKDMVNSYMGGLLIAIAGILVLGVAGAFGLSRYLYNPVKQLTDEILHDHRFAGTPEDLVLLKKAISTMKQEEEQLRKNQERNELGREEYYLRTLILNGYSLEEAPDSLSRLSRGSRICAVHLLFDQQEERWRELDEAGQFYFRNLLSQVLAQMLQEAGCSGKGVYAGRNGLYVVVFDARQGEELTALLRRYISYVRENFEIRISVGLSDWFDSLEQIAGAAERAYQASGRVFFLGWGCVVTQQELPLEQAKEYAYPVQAETDLICGLEEGNERLVCRAVHNYCEMIRQMKEMSVENAVLMLHQLTGAVMKKLSEKIERPEQIMEISRKMYKIFTVQGYSLEEYEQELTGYLCELPYIQKTQINPGEQLYRQMLDYIREHYRENIGANEIAEALQISYSYTRKIFKENAGISPSDYIHKLRVEEAKRLLGTSTKSVVQIAEEVGYNNDQSFLRAFKKLVGSSPAAFRKGLEE